MKLCDLRNVATLFAVLTGLLFAAGCDTTGQYNVRVSEAANSVGKGGGGGAAGGLLAQESPIGNPTIAYIKLPDIFQTPATLQAEPRAQLPFVLPGFMYCYEAAVDVNGKRSPAYAYFGRVPIDEAAFDGIKVLGSVERAQVCDQFCFLLVTKIEAAIPGAKALLRKAEKSLTPVPTSMIEVSGTLSFDATQMGGAVEAVPGRFDFFVHQTNTDLIWVGWRAPNTVIDKSQLIPKIVDSMKTFRTAEMAAPGNQPAAAGRPVGGIDNIEVNWAYNFPDRTLTVKGKDGNYVLNATVANGQPIQQQGTLNQILAKLDQLPPQLANEVAACKKSYADLQAMMAPK